MTGKIYEITNLINGKRYFGQTKQDGRRRWSEHKYSAVKRKTKTPLNWAIRKYGISAFRFQIIVDNIGSQEELDRLEILWIDKCGTIDINVGYNLSTGGNGPFNCKPKITSFKKGRIPWNKGKTGVYSKEWIKNRSELSINLWKKDMTATKKKMAENSLCRKRDEKGRWIK